jgi:hypothetical protein
VKGIRLENQMVGLYIISSPGFTILFICSFARDQLIEEGGVRGGGGGGGVRGGEGNNARTAHRMKKTLDLHPVLPPP